MERWEEGWRNKKKILRKSTKSEKQDKEKKLNQPNFGHRNSFLHANIYLAIQVPAYPKTYRKISQVML